MAASSRLLAARILLALVWVLAAAQAIRYFGARHQLDSPLFPDSVARAVALPYLFSALFLAAFGLAAALLLFRRKHWAVIVLCAAALLLDQIGHQYALYWNLVSP